MNVNNKSNEFLSALPIFIITFFVMMLDGYDLQVIAIVLPKISEQWGIVPAEFGVAQSAAILGLGIGAAILGPLGDMYGRRKIILTTFTITLISVWLTAYTYDLTTLTLARFGTGLGLGAAVVNVSSLLAKHAPKKYMALTLTVAGCGIPVGGMLSGMLAPKITLNYGWPAAFWLSVGGSLLVLVLLFIWLPNDATKAESTQQTTANNSKSRIQALELLGARYRKTTLSLWLLYIGNSFLLYTIVSWLPTLLTSEGWDLAKAGSMIGLFQTGGLVGSLVVASMMDKWGVRRSLMTSYVVAMTSFTLFLVDVEAFVWPVLITLIGAAISSVALTVNALSANVYPNRQLAAGIGFTIAAARLGAVAAPIIGAAMIAAQMHIGMFMGVLLLPAVVCVAALWILTSSARTTSQV